MFFKNVKLRKVLHTLKKLVSLKVCSLVLIRAKTDTLYGCRRSFSVLFVILILFILRIHVAFLA